MARNTSMALKNLQRGARTPQGESLQWGYYDTLKLSNAVRDYDFFLAGLGANYGGVNKTEAQTNLPSSGTIPQGHRLWIYDIHVSYFSHEAKPTTFIQDLYAFIWGAWTKLGIVGKDAMLFLPLSEYVGQVLYAAITPTAAGDNLPFTQGIFKGIYPLSKPIVLPALQNFSLKLTANTLPTLTVGGEQPRIGQTDDELRFLLNGKLERLG